MCSLHVLLISRGRVGLLTSAAFMAICSEANHTKTCYTHAYNHAEEVAGYTVVHVHVLILS